MVGKSKSVAEFEKLFSLLKVITIETVTEAGARGVPGGYLYAALSSRGITLHTYNFLMSELVDEGKLRRVGEVYYAVPDAGEQS